MNKSDAQLWSMEWPESLCISRFLLDRAVFALLLPFPTSPLCAVPWHWTGAGVTSPSPGRVAVRRGSLELQLSIAHSFQQKLSHVRKDSVPPAGGNVTEEMGSVNHTRDAHRKIILIANLASTSDHQTWDCFQLLPLREDNVREFLSKSSCAALPAVPFFFPFPLGLMSKQQKLNCDRLGAAQS